MSRAQGEDTSQYWNESVLSPTEVKLQHYVPRFYLRAFADTKGQIHVVDMEPPGREFDTGVAVVAVEKGFYDIDIGSATLSTESWLAELEGSALPVLRGLIDDPDMVLGLSLEEEMALARFLAAFRFRTPAFRDQLDALKQQMVAHAKRIATGYVRNNYPEAQAKLMLEAWEEQPDDWWLGNSAPSSTAETAAGMLSEVQGYANLLWAMPWRIGRVPSELPLYTSDNPLAGRIPPIRPWWEGGAFGSLRYYVPLSPDVLMQIDPVSRKAKGEGADLRGNRRRRDFDHWQTRYALMTVSSQARRFIFGSAPAIPREQAIEWLQFDDIVTRSWAMRFTGYDPRPPWNR